MTDSKTVLDGPRIAAAQLADWRPLLGVLTARFRTGDFATGLELVERVGAAAEAANHHPDVELTYPAVTIGLTSHDVGGITSRDLDLAQTISGFAADLGAAAEPAGVARLELALDTEDVAAIRPFWAALVGAELGDAPDEASIRPVRCRRSGSSTPNRAPVATPARPSAGTWTCGFRPSRCGRASTPRSPPAEPW
jgi:4a-hydroxytetrahydrobiopterin dehydratase